MEWILVEIKFNEQGYHVVLLHQVLAAFGFTVSQFETINAKAGKNTQKMVSQLRKYLRVREIPHDPNIILVHQSLSTPTH